MRWAISQREKAVLQVSISASNYYSNTLPTSFASIPSMAKRKQNVIKRHHGFSVLIMVLSVIQSSLHSCTHPCSALSLNLLFCLSSLFPLSASQWMDRPTFGSPRSFRNRSRLLPKHHLDHLWLHSRSVSLQFDPCRVTWIWPSPSWISTFSLLSGHFHNFYLQSESLAPLMDINSPLSQRHSCDSKIDMDVSSASVDGMLDLNSSHHWRIILDPISSVLDSGRRDPRNFVVRESCKQSILNLIPKLILFLLFLSSLSLSLSPFSQTSVTTRMRNILPDGQSERV